mgnify:CR=1 FL=1
MGLCVVRLVVLFVVGLVALCGVCLVALCVIRLVASCVVRLVALCVVRSVSSVHWLCMSSAPCQVSSVAVRCALTTIDSLVVDAISDLRIVTLVLTVSLHPTHDILSFEI